MPHPHDPLTLTEQELHNLEAVVALGFENAARGLSAMVDKRIRVVSPRLCVVPTTRVPTLIGQADEEVVAIYLSVTGEAVGHILLILSRSAADELLVMLLGGPSAGDASFDTIAKSALGEVANVMGAFFLNALADETRLLLHPSPPCLMTDLAGAILEIPLLTLALSTEEVLLIDTWFVDEGRRIEGLFLMLPDAESLRLIVDRLGV